MMRKLIVTRCDDKIAQMCELTHPRIQDYAKRCDADFMTLTHTVEDAHGDGRWHYRIMALQDLLTNHYDRVLHVDSDVLISADAPNIFDVVPLDSIGSIFEDKGSRRAARVRHMQAALDRFGDCGWREGYINTGLFLASKSHAGIFERIKGEWFNGLGHDDVHLGWQIAKNDLAIHELPHEWNHMTMHSEPWNGYASRFSAHCIHYAGKGIFDIVHKTKLAQMKADILELESRSK